MNPPWLLWHWFSHVMGWDSVVSDFYAFGSGSGFLFVAWAVSMGLWWWRTSCHERRWCLRHGRHDITDPETGVNHKVCWKHAGLPAKYAIGRIREIQAKHGLLYLGERPGRG